MMFKYRIVLIFTFCLLLCGSIYAAGYIPGVTATATSEYSTRPVVHIVDGSGFTLLPNGNGTHTITEDNTMWLGGPPAGDNNPEVYFNFGSVHYVSYMMFWNYNGPAAGGLGVQEADIYYSLDSDPCTASWTLLVNDQVFTAGPANDTDQFGQQVNLNVNARLIRFDINKGLADQIYPGAGGWTGISEVRFYDPNLPDQPIGDIDGDWSVDLTDYALFAEKYLWVPPVLQDDFSGTTIDTGSWTTVAGEGTISQNDELIFANTSQTSGWDVDYVYTNSVFPRITPDGEVLTITFTTKMTQEAAFICGVYPDGPYQGWSHGEGGVDYGYHGNRMDRALWFLEQPALTYLTRLVEDGQQYRTIKLRMEAGPDNGAMWEYDLGDGWKLARDTRQEGIGVDAENYKFFITSYFYANGELIIDDVNIAYKIPTNISKIDSIEWPLPVSADFNGAMDERWTNWAGTTGILPWGFSTADFTSAPGWVVFDGPADGYGMYLRHLPFLAENVLPFYAEAHLRYPVIDPPECNYMVYLQMLMDVDSDLYTDDVAYPRLIVQNFPGSSQTVVTASHADLYLDSLNSGPIPASSYWNSGDLYLRLGYEADRTLSFAYKFNVVDPWNVFYTYDPSVDDVAPGIPFACDLIGPAVDVGCAPDQTSYEVDYVHFYSGLSPYNSMPFTDDFEDGVLDPNKWEIDAGAITEADGHAIIPVGAGAVPWGEGTFSTFDNITWPRTDPNGWLLRLTFEADASQGIHCIGGFAPAGGKNIYDIVYGMSRLYGNNAIYAWNGSFVTGVGGPVTFKARITLGADRGALYEYDIYNLGWTALYDNRGIAGDQSDGYQVMFDNGGSSSTAEFYVDNVVVEYVDPNSL